MIFYHKPGVPLQSGTPWQHRQVDWRKALSRWAKIGLLSATALGSILPAGCLAETATMAKHGVAMSNNTSSEANSHVSVQIPKELETAIKEQGSARVIIGLKANFKPEGELANQEEVVKQQANIAQTRGELLSWLKNNSSLPLEEKEFATIPYIAINANQEILKLLVQNPLVASLRLDDVVPLSAPNNMEVAQ